MLRLEGWARDGLSDEQIANNAGIAAGTLYAWMNAYPEIREAIKKGKAPCDIEIENKLFESAKGYTYTVSEPIKIKTRRQLSGKGTIEEEHIEYVEREIHVPPNVAAIIFWLTNRKPKQWRNNRKFEEPTEVNNGKLNELINGLSEIKKEVKKENGNE